MKMKTTTVSLLAAGLLSFAIAASAQHSQHQASAPEPSTQMMNQGMMGQGMMGHGMMGHTMMGPSMMANHQEMMKLMNQLAGDLSAAENEKDATVIRKKLTEDGALLQQLQAHMRKNGQMVGQMMEYMQNCPMAQSGQTEGQATPK